MSVRSRPNLSRVGVPCCGAGRWSARCSPTRRTRRSSRAAAPTRRRAPIRGRTWRPAGCGPRRSPGSRPARRARARADVGEAPMCRARSCASSSARLTAGVTAMRDCGGPSPAVRSISAGQGVRIGAGPDDQVADRLRLQRGPQQVLRLQVRGCVLEPRTRPPRPPCAASARSSCGRCRCTARGGPRRGACVPPKRRARNSLNGSGPKPSGRGNHCSYVRTVRSQLGRSVPVRPGFMPLTAKSSARVPWRPRLTHARPSRRGRLGRSPPGAEAGPAPVRRCTAVRAPASPGPCRAPRGRASGAGAARRLAPLR